MNDLKNDVVDETKKLADNIAHPENETKKEARKRQPWMPILGAFIAALILLSIFFAFSS